MFDDVKDNQGGDKPAREPEDIFAATEDNISPPAEQKSTLSADAEQPPATVPAIQYRSGSSTRWLKILLAAVVAVIVGLGGYFGYQYFGQKKTIIPSNENRQSEVESPTTAGNSDSSEITPPPAEEPPAEISEPDLDSDNDGLTDVEERQHGTDENKPDTDNDGLFDREEIMVYDTDPLRPDTDGDGYLDGEEVRAGYNPKGPGKLLPEPPTS